MDRRLERFAARVARALVLLHVAGSFLTATAQSQPHGRIIGSVIDSETTEPLIGANVILERTTKGAASDLKGEFIIDGVEPGTYTVLVTVLSYAKQRIENVVIRGGETVRLNVVMKPETITLGEVVVEAKSVLSYEGALLTQQRKATSIGDGISAEQIKRSPDASSADALRRVTGISIVDNKFLFVRGTPERYSNTMLNGSPVASTEPDKRAFSFDILPSNLIESGVITKSFTPDLPGDFAGGVAKLSTIDFPSALTFQANTFAAFHGRTSLRPFTTSPGGKNDYLGIDDGTRSLPAGFPKNLGDPSHTPPDILRYARSLKNNWAPRQTHAPLNGGFLLSLGDGITFLGNNFGFVTALTYRSSFENSSIERNEYEASGEPRFQYTGQQSVHSVSWGAIGNFSYRPSNVHRVSLRNTYTRDADDEATQFFGIQYTDIGAEQKHVALRYVSRAVYSGQVTGEHFFPFLNSTQMEWKASYSESDRQEPDYRRIVYFREAGSNDPFTASLGFQANLKNGGRYYSTLSDRSRGVAVDFSTPISTAKLKFGTFVDRKVRDFGSRLIGIVVNGRGNGFTDAELYTLPIDRIFAPENFRRNGFSLDEYQNGTNNYTAEQTITAWYAMLDMPLNLLEREFRLIAGARMERSVQRVVSKDVSALKEIRIELANVDVMPSVNLIYVMDENANLRLAYSQTVNRPELRELAPFAYFDFNTQTSLRGNDHLRQSLIRNYDLRYELFPRAGELLSASVFYKSFSDAIEQVVVSGSALGSERTFLNAESARNYGIELEARLGLSLLARVLEPFSLRGNYARIKSSVNVAGTETTLQKRNRPLQGQSPSMLNLGLQYSNPDLGTSISLFYYRFGPRIVEVATAYEEDVIEQPRQLVDLVITQSIAERYEVKLTAKDILAEEQVFLQGNKRARANEKGTLYSLGIAFKIN
ncbi:MAG TPA: TonB-dependent receptor [Bacteroidota bacterium]|nr:TonB-dependent receptor [Bacteroidota bacterium]